MKLRTRLFLWVSSLFILFFAVSYFAEVYLINNSIKQSERQMEEEIERASEAKRKNFEEFIGIQIANIQAQIDALLFRIKEYPYLQLGFIPTEDNISGNTWSAAASLLLHYKWISFIQNTINGKITSSLVPSYQDLHPIVYYKINENLYWVFIKDQASKPYLALKLGLEYKGSHLNSFYEIDAGKFNDVYFLFDWRVLKEFKEPPPLDLSNFEESFSSATGDMIADLRKETLERIKEAQDFLTTAPVQQLEKLPLSEFQEFVKKTYPEKGLYKGHKGSIPISVIEKGEKGSSDLIDEEFIHTFSQTRDKDDSVVLSWVLTTFLATDLFGSDPLSLKAPAGVVIISPNRQVSTALMSEGTFYTKKIFDDQKYVTSTPIDLVEVGIPSSFALIDYADYKDLFIGNTLLLKQGNNQSLLTLGVAISDLMRKVSLATDQFVSLVHKNQVNLVYDNNGVELDKSPFYSIPLQDLSEIKGLVKVDGEEYYYMKMQPYENVDLLFYLFQTKAKAFTFVTFLKDTMSKALSQIALKMQILALIAVICSLIVLEFISRRITGPITKLAKATIPISEGHFDQVVIPEVTKARKDEINILCHSFSEMIQGLKDREKVKGVLNKVVSKEIAEEILKGNISLGGEEKQATIVFADIRNFTHLTEKMDPKDVIELLNTCMTKISSVVDEFGGVIDKYIGDEAMALFGAPVTHADHAKKACLSALEMIKKIEEWNLERTQKGLPLVHIGIGICTGVIVAGNMGAENRLNYTVLGANVNLGARLCSLAKPKEILITKNTVESAGVKEAIDIVEMEAVILKGFTEPVPVFRIIGLKDYG